MSETQNLDEVLKMAEIDKVKAQTARLQMEAEKLRAETLKLQKDVKWHPWLAIILASVAIVVAFIK